VAQLVKWQTLDFGSGDESWGQALGSAGSLLSGFSLPLALLPLTCVSSLPPSLKYISKSLKIKNN